MIELPSMKNLLIIFLLIIMPFQSVWAAADYCCQQPNEIASQHIEVAEQEDITAIGAMADEDKNKPSSYADSHCSQCHLVGAYASVATRMQALPISTAVSVGIQSEFASLPPSKPERPKWLAAA